MRMFPPGPEGQADTAPWRRWLLPAALMAGFLVLLSLPRGTAPGMTPRTARGLAAEARVAPVPPAC